MIGSIIGDICGSTYEFSGIKHVDFDLTHPASEITDDSILSFATAETLLRGGDYAEAYRRYGTTYRFPMGGYGHGFKCWLYGGSSEPYNSCGNGSAMRVGPVGWACDTVEAVLKEAARSAGVTHDHPEGIKGAQATALAVFMARHKASKEDIRSEISGRFGYDLSRTCDEIRPGYHFKPTCQETVPEALAAFFDSTSYEHALRLAISLGGDADTLACIAGGIAEAWYGSIPDHLQEFATPRIPEPLSALLQEFRATYGPSHQP
jgi:ADP-ribosyl-[dinitrogen reductase] hydrolase